MPQTGADGPSDRALGPTVMAALGIVGWRPVLGAAVPKGGVARPGPPGQCPQPVRPQRQAVPQSPNPREVGFLAVRNQWFQTKFLACLECFSFRLNTLEKQT